MGGQGKMNKGERALGGIICPMKKTADARIASAPLTKYHWGVIICCCLTNGLPAAMLMNVPGIFFPVVSEDLGVQTAEISAYMTIAMLSATIIQPIVGNLVRLVKMRVLMLAGALIMMGVLLVFSIATAPWMFWAAAVVAGTCFATCMSVGPATLANRWFHQKVGLLLGVFAAMAAFGGVIFMLLGQAIIDAYGWRAAYQVYAACILVICVPAILIGARDYPSDCGVKPYGMLEADEEFEPLPVDGDDSPAREAAGRRSDGVGKDEDFETRVRACMFTPAFALLLVAGFLMNLVCMANAYMPKYVYWLEEQASLGLMSTAFVSGVVLNSLCQAGSGTGKLILGAFSDISVRKALTLLCGAGAVGLACVWFFPSTPLVILGGFIYGFFLASILVLVPMLVREIFGSGELYPMLYARTAMAPSLGAASANILWPVLADGFGFDMVFGLALVFVAVIFVCCLIALSLPRKRV